MTRQEPIKLNINWNGSECPITREQVEKMRSEWKHRFTTDDSVFCTSCKTTFRAYYDEYNFCSDCGAPMTDKAVDILWNRLEAMQDATD